MKLSNRERVLIIVGGLVIAIVAYIFYFVMPLSDRAAKSTKELNDANQQAQILKSEAIGVQKLKDDVSKLTGELDKKTAALMSSMDDAQIMIYLQKLTDGKASGLNVVFDPTIDETGLLLRQTVTLEFNATYRNMTDIIDALNKADVYNKVQVVNATYRQEAVIFAPDATAPTATPPAGTAATATSKPTATPTPTAKDPNVLKVHIETYFFARKPVEGVTPTPVIPATTADRGGSIFPEE